MDPLTEAHSNTLEAEANWKKNPCEETEKTFGRAKWALHVLIKQNLEVLNYYAQGGTDGGIVARQFIGSGLKGLQNKVPCANCGDKK